MIEHPNSLLVQHYLQAVSEGDHETLRALWSPTIVWHAKGLSPWQGDFRGADQILDFLSELGSLGGAGLNTEIEDIMISNTHAAMICHAKTKPDTQILAADFLVIMNILGRQIHEITSVPIDLDRATSFWREAAGHVISRSSPPLVAV